MKHKLHLALVMIIPVGLVITTIIYGYIEKKFAYFKEINSFLISIPMLLYIFLIPGLKMVIKTPVVFEANWFFRMTEKKEKKRYLVGFKKTLFFYAIFPLFILLLLFYSFIWGFKLAIYHSFFGITIALLLMEVLFIKYRNMPFASNCLPYKANLKYSWFIYLFLFSLYLTNMTALGLFLIKTQYIILFFMLRLLLF